MRSVISTISTHLFHGERLDQTQIGDEKRLNEKGSDLWASKGPMSPTSVGFSLTIALVQNMSEMLESKKKSLSFTTAFKNIERKILDQGNKNLNATMTVSSQGKKEREMSPGDFFAHSSDGRRPDAVALHLNKGQEEFDR